MTFYETDLKQVMADIFGVSEGSIDESTSIDTLYEWGSIKHMNLVSRPRLDPKIINYRKLEDAKNYILKLVNYFEIKGTK